MTYFFTIFSNYTFISRLKYAILIKYAISKQQR